jgi:HEAT repeat protein
MTLAPIRIPARGWLLSALFVFASGVAVGTPELFAQQLTPYAKALADKGIEPEAEGISAYLVQLHPTPELRATSIKLIEQLGDGSFIEREEAMQKLLISPVLDTEALAAAASDDDPEVRWRARKILQVGKPETERLLYAAFKTIEEQKLHGTLEALIAAIPLCEKSTLRQQAQIALVAAARREDTPLLVKALASENPHVRTGAAAALGEALGKEADETLLPLATDESASVRLAVARAMANYGERRSLDLLIDLLEADDVEIRTHASTALSSLTKKFLGYAAYDKPEKRAESVTKWREWLAADGKSAELHFPLKPFGYGVSFLNGNTLLAHGNRNLVVELDPEGKEVWKYTIAGAWSAEKMANGNVLIASNSQSKVVEVDRDGKVVWEYSTPNPLNAKPLPNGNVLIAAFTQRKVIEVDREKKIVWSHEAGQYVSDAHRLENGNTLISCMNGPVRELTPDGKTVWEYSGAPQAYGCQPLATGNVLIASLQGTVTEVNRAKEVVWEHREQNPCDVFRLPNGNTLITGAQKFVEITPDKRVVWERGGCQYGSARR